MGDQYKLCASDGELLPVNFPCPPPNYPGAYYYYNPDDASLHPPDTRDANYGNTGYNSGSSSTGEGPSITSGAVAGIIISGAFIFFALCLIAVKCRAKFILGYGRNARNRDQLTGDQLLVSGGDAMVVNIAGCGLEERLMKLLPVYEYVGLMQQGKVLDAGKERQECSVCLNLFEEKETVRVLPKCHHVFHIHCIDKWFESHANCPLCRERITLQTIQLSLESSDKPADHDHQSLDPSALAPPRIPTHDHDHSDQLSSSDHLDRSSSSKIFCVHPDHERLAGDQLQHPLPSAALTINHPYTTEASDQPGVIIHAECDHQLADDRYSADFPQRVQGHCDHKNPAVITAKFMQFIAESKQDKNALKEPARPLLYRTTSSDDDAQATGPLSAACSLHSFYKHLNLSAARIDRSARAVAGASNHQSHQHEADNRRCLQERKGSGEFLHRSMLQASAGDHIKTAHSANLNAEQQTGYHFARALAIVNANARATTGQLSFLRKSLSTGSLDSDPNGKASTHAPPAPTRLARCSTRIVL